MISLYHPLTNFRAAPVDITFDYTSSLGIPWTVYSDNAGEPESPIEGPLSLGGSERSAIWMIAEIPAETPSGAETVLITATNVMADAQTAWASDVLWVGEWVAPPPPSWSAYSIYLPLVFR